MERRGCAWDFETPEGPGASDVCYAYRLTNKPGEWKKKNTNSFRPLATTSLATPESSPSHPSIHPATPKL